MSLRSHSAHNSESENERADSVDHPIGERSIEGSDSEPGENSDSDRQVSEPSENSGSDRQLSDPSDDLDSDGQVSEPSENADSDLQDSEASDNSDSGCQVSETSENSDSDRRRGKRKRHLSLVSDESSPKRRRRRRKPAVDLITALPDSLLLHVLSFLPIEDAVKAQVLSKRWQYLWTCLTSLDFRFGDRPDKCNSDFVTFVDKTLFLCICSKIKKLGVQFEYEFSSESNVNLWTRFAAVKGAEELQLDFDGAKNDYWLPQLLYTNSSFKTLQFNVCWVWPEKVVCWNSLKKLSIGYSRLSEDVIQKILVGSPVLEILELSYFYGFNRLHVHNASVKKLILRDVWDDWDEGEEEYRIDGGRYHYLLEISAPHLHSLEISGDLCDKICRLGNVSSLVDANLSFHELEHSFDPDVYELYQNMLKDLLQSLVHVKKITLGTWAIEVLRRMEAKGLRSPVLKCECLTLDTGIRKSVLPGIAHMLESSPKLETLVISVPSSSCHKFSWDRLCNFDEKHYWTSRKQPFTCLMFHLQKVKIIGLGRYKVDYYLSFVQFLLKNARVLQKLVIDAQMGSQTKFAGATQKLLSFPRFSPDAVVLFYE